jgi:hypothetical protein
MRCLTVWLLAAGLAAQTFPGANPRPDKRDEPVRLPNGKLQSEEILKEEHLRSLKDSSELKKLIEEFHEELEKSDRHVVSVSMLKKLDEIEKRTKRIRGRLTRY